MDSQKCGVRLRSSFHWLAEQYTLIRTFEDSLLGCPNIQSISYRWVDLCACRGEQHTTCVGVGHVPAMPGHIVIRLTSRVTVHVCYTENPAGSLSCISGIS